jgi:5-methylthioadenosine/S-adenosylhomocysteine deaminase
LKNCFQAGSELGALGGAELGKIVLPPADCGQASSADMAAHGVGLIWSPRSNFELYGTTTDVAAAKSAGVVMAISRDWSPSGSSGMLEELKYAKGWNARQNPRVFEDADLVKMATIYPAQPAGLGDKIGSLWRGYFANLLVLRRKGAEPYAALLHGTPLDVRLVVVGGKPVYGDRDLMEKLLPGALLEPVSFCRKDEQKVLYLGIDATASPLRKTWKETTEQLDRALHQWNIRLAELVRIPTARIRRKSRCLDSWALKIGVERPICKCRTVPRSRFTGLQAR